MRFYLPAILKFGSKTALEEASLETTADRTVKQACSLRRFFFFFFFENLFQMLRSSCQTLFSPKTKKETLESALLSVCVCACISI
jgi:hypothetical protein